MDTTNANNEMTNVASVATKGGLPFKKATKTSEYTQGKDWKIFEVDCDCFEKFRTGRKKFERWGRFLNMDDDTHKSIYDYASANRKNTIVLRCSQTGALRAIRRRSSNDL
jgi:hypothetical protein